LGTKKSALGFLQEQIVRCSCSWCQLRLAWPPTSNQRGTLKPEPTIRAVAQSVNPAIWRSVAARTLNIRAEGGPVNLPRTSAFWHPCGPADHPSRRAIHRHRLPHIRPVNQRDVANFTRGATVSQVRPFPPVPHTGCLAVVLALHHRGRRLNGDFAASRQSTSTAQARRNVGTSLPTHKVEIGTTCRPGGSPRAAAASHRGA
jgi:hypothetical protein